MMLLARGAGLTDPRAPSHVNERRSRAAQGRT
jgi:hypothetical protein